MWLFTTFGFFSVVQKVGEEELTVRARVADDLDRLRSNYMSALGPTIHGAGTDYPARARIGREAFAAGVAEIARDIDYSNFKDAAKKTLGPARSSAHAKVWEAMYSVGAAEKKAAMVRSPFPSPPARKLAYGGVVFDERERVLLREPTNHYGGYVWTFPKGRGDAGEPAEAVALREVREESGIEARIVGSIPEWFIGDETATGFFLMEIERDHGDFDDAETQKVAWVDADEARTLISISTTAKGKKRDLAVLAKAFEARRRRTRC